ncbi:acyloxyacyl hydrolase [Histidinibacterium aquaticum]|uniref:Acyloxyacyl hydrolase n=1 Tax=Histidinibacterium aquaticum TaxID=2613962 RepID=A0A5J5GNQ6_9RHOB|nr:acyloxyacyl hydrolase [Histidinibacterium aquaticum]KAA9009072.1 acyloxyacyl hydrolase [Histidinibacterium aquaticum]
MDGTLAVIFVVMGLTDMGLTYCPTSGCLAEVPETGRLGIQAGAVSYQEERIGQEIALDYALPRSYGPFQPAVGFSVSDESTAWAGFGLRTDYDFGRGVTIEGSLMPGFYAPGDGPDIGGNLQFRSSLGVSYEFLNEARVGVYYDHRSNAGIQDDNPGLETYGLRVSFPLR